MTNPHMIAVPANHIAIILPITDNADDDGAAIIDSAIALHHVTDMLENGEDG